VTHYSDPKLQRLHESLNELNRKLMAGELDIPPEHERSPSPEPIYDANGVRLNTREIRCVRGYRRGGSVAEGLEGGKGSCLCAGVAARQLEAWRRLCCVGRCRTVQCRAVSCTEGAAAGEWKAGMMALRASKLQLRLL
jgi:hypothetical protein